MDNRYATLNDKQLEAVTSTEGPLLVLAGAGSGKTRALTHRIAYLIGEKGVSPYSILALTFTNKAAGEMKARVAKLVGEGAQDIWVSTFHSSCVRILRRFIDTIGYDRDFVIYDTDDQKAIMKEVMKDLNLDPKRFKEKTILGEISRAKDQLKGPEQYAAEAVDFMERKIADCYTEYQERMRKNNALDFDDLIFKTIELFDINKEALGYYRRRFRYILVDEYQDTNRAQFMLISMLAEYMNEYGEIEHNLCVVGDDDQSIYGFRGADIRNILDFEKEYPDTKVIRLEQNYRSTKNILDCANEVIKHNRGRKSKTLWTENEQGDDVNLICYPDDRAEAAGTVSDIAQKEKEGFFDYRDFAILYRTNAQSRSFEESLIFRNIPYRIIGGQNFYQRKEIKDVLAYLRTIASGADSVSVKRIINIPKRGIGQTTLDKISEFADGHDMTYYDALLDAEFIPGITRAVGKIKEFTDMIDGFRKKLSEGLSLTELIDEILEATGYVDYLLEEDDEQKAKDRVDNINELVSKLATYVDETKDTEEGSSLTGFLAEVSLVADIDSMEEDDNCVLLMTIHSAKGLEFENVYLVGMEEGLFPSAMSINSQDPDRDTEEERRLCYVGMTRAKQHLTLTYAKQRMMRGEITFSAPSRFIAEVPRYMLKCSGNTGSTKLRDESYGRDRGSYGRDGDYGRGSSFGRSYSFADDDRIDNSGHSEAAHSMLSSNPYAKNMNTAGLYSSPSPTPSKDFGSGPVDGGELGFSIGDTVHHFKFGNGTVLNIVRGGKAYEVTVDFNGTQRKMLSTFAKLTKV